MVECAATCCSVFRDDGVGGPRLLKRQLFLLLHIVWLRSFVQTSLKQDGCYVTRPEARARPCASELTDLSCSGYFQDAEFMPVAIFLSMDRTRLFERAL